MDLTVTIYLLIAESVFFSVLLVVCLKMAKNKNYAHLKKLMEIITKSEEKTKAINSEKKSIEDIKKQLFEQITGLQNEITNLKKTKQLYERLKVRYGELKNTYEKLKNASKENSINNTVSESIIEVDSSSSKTDAGIDDYEKIISELKETIKELEASTEESNEDKLSESDEKRYEDIDGSLESSENAKITIGKLSEELEYYKNRVFDLEKQTHESPASADKNKYKIVSKSAKDTEGEKQLDDSEQLRKEINSLRGSSADQRRIIFDLEKEINQLRLETSNNDLSSELKSKKEDEMALLERKLNETEGCINILENELEFLNEKLVALERGKDKNTSATAEPNISRSDSNKAASPITISRQIKNIISSTQDASSDRALELITTKILDAIEPLDIDVFLTIKSTLGEVEVTAKDNWIAEDKLTLEDKLNKNSFFSETNNDVLRIGAYHIGMLATPVDIEKAGSIADYEDALSIMLLVSDTVIDHLENREKNANKGHAFKKVVDTVRTDAQKISIQQNYQTTEAQRIIDSFLVDLNNSLNTMNITENQSAFFEAMIQEVRGRMDLLLSTRSSVESDFTTMIGKLEKNGGSLLH